MQDLQERRIDYMRISITDRCNLRCKYCMPNYVNSVPMKDILTFEEILLICKQAVSLGITKFKLTGGEPLVRKGCTELVRGIKEIRGVEQVTMTTNGVLLRDYIDGLVSTGLDAVNISLDTIDAQKFKEITGSDKLDAVLESIHATVDAGIKAKINTVLQKGCNEDEWISIINLAKSQNLDVRFIEMMPIGQGNSSKMIPNYKLLREMRRLYPGIRSDKGIRGNGPAMYYKIPGFMGRIGFISPINEKFCASCNRIRLTTVGDIKPCLCFGESISVLEAVRNGNCKDIRRIIKNAIMLKPKQHCFENPSAISEKKQMAEIGG